MAHGCTHEHHDAAGLSGPPLQHALAEADRLMAERERRLTPQRRRVLELLLGADGPIRAYEIMAAFQPGGAPAKPPTVYRALDFLAAEGLAHRIESLNAYVACRVAGGAEGAHAAAFLICDCCGAAVELADGAKRVLADAAALAEMQGYALSALTLEARGRCPACRDRTAEAA